MSNKIYEIIGRVWNYTEKEAEDKKPLTAKCMEEYAKSLAKEALDEFDSLIGDTHKCDLAYIIKTKFNIK
ncbi:hypothetical protein [Mucilaginibacter sp. 10I4]|uniref:hypothetical protein n=1 Tax=Mucilaginibacter sp. 10I4 TaxID=3048580 RepID=UPI002B239D09|nr:hypothetical protein [Mucilaginibacter sp. 10I4]MEB0262896.1 hypothetical protein [Mucilaginibacter sp. 10I4]